MGCSTSIVKFILFAFNFLIVLGGAGLITIGALSLSGFNEYHDYVDLSKYNAAPITTIVFGSIVLVIAFMGCCGVLRESNCMMMTYAIFLGIILLVQIGIVVAAHVYRDDFDKLLAKGFEESRKSYGSDPEATKNWDQLQQRLKCCGVNSYTDWLTEFKAIPESCCIIEKPGCVGVIAAVVAPQTTIYTQGCVQKALDDLAIDHIIWPIAIVVAVELLGIIFGCCLAARFRHAKYRSS